MSEVNKDEVLASAKKIMDDFMMELDTCNVDSDDFGQVRKTNKREFKDNNPVDGNFIKGMFKNAPKTRDNFIIAETKKKE